MIFPVSFLAWVYETLEAVFLAFYMIECVLKLISFGLEYFKSLWNILGELANLLFFISYSYLKHNSCEFLSCLMQAKTICHWGKKIHNSLYVF